MITRICDDYDVIVQIYSLTGELVMIRQIFIILIYFHFKMEKSDIVVNKSQNNINQQELLLDDCGKQTIKLEYDVSEV